MNGEVASVAFAPDESFGTGRLQFAMLSQQGSIGREIKQGAVERAADSRVFPFNDANGEVDSRLPRHLPDCLRDRAGDFDGCFVESPEKVASFGSPTAYRHSEGEATRIEGEKGFGEEKELRP